MKKTYIIPRSTVHRIDLKRSVMVLTTSGSSAEQGLGMDVKADNFSDAWADEADGDLWY